jgi:two-component system, chemotaxis family, sensor kinase CheA
VTEDFNFSTGMPADDMGEYLQMFVDETAEQLDDLVEVLLVLESAPDSIGHLNESFRLIHSIKGAAAMMGLDSITLLTHHLENHFERLRSGIKSLDRPMIDLILRCVDFLRGAVETIREGRPLVSAPELIEQLSNAVADTAKSPPASTRAAVSVNPRSEPAESISSAAPNDEVHTRDVDAQIRKRMVIYFDRSIDLPELKSELILARLSELGSVTRTSPAAEELASLYELRTLQVWLESSSSDDTLRTAADIVGVDLIEIDDCGLDEYEDSDRDVGEDELVELLKNNAKPTSPLVEAPPIASAVAQSAEIVADPVADSTGSEQSSRVVETVRVDIQRLDQLMNLAGELVVNRARFLQLASQMTETFKKSGLISQLRDLCDVLREQLSSTPESSTPISSTPISSTSCQELTEINVDLAGKQRLEIQATVVAFEEQLQVLERGRRSFIQLNEAIDQFSRVSDRLQRGVLDTRMVPVGPLFNRFKRTVRDISNELGKKVNLVIRGEDTELDKRMIDELGDPLVHLVRNAIDHGLESESVRRSRGKPQEGTLTLEAVHRGNSVLITISDDGGGIDTEKVKRRAIERGIVSSAEVGMMSDHEIAQFIWAPGFSTADVVSDISGRGVGMDIVKTRIGELNGTVEVDSTIGVGTKFVIRLPLTLAIIRSLLFKINQEIFAAPIENVREIVSINNRDILTVHGRDSIEVRGEFIPLVRIDDVFDWHQTQYCYAEQAEIESDVRVDETNALIMTTGTKSMALVVSELKGCQHIVVKSLDENFTHIRGLAGASILGDGSVCLLLDVVTCLELARQRLRERSHHRTIATT